MRRIGFVTTCLAGALGALVVAKPNLAQAQPTCAIGTSGVCTVALGTDYFHTRPGTSADLGPFGLVDLAGLAFGPGGTDTTVERQADANINGLSIPLLLTGLQLVSTNLMSPIFVSLDPTNLANDTGSMLISGNLSGGTFSSSLDVFFDICTAPGVRGIGCGAGSLLATAEDKLNNSGSKWLPSPPSPADLVVSGAFGDQAANLHSGLPCNDVVCEVDFFPTGVIEIAPLPPSAIHSVRLAFAPEPTTVAILGIGLLGLGLVRRRRS